MNFIGAKFVIMKKREGIFHIRVDVFKSDLVEMFQTSWRCEHRTSLLFIKAAMAVQGI